MPSQLQRLTIAPQQQQENQIVLTPAQKHYLLRVLRLGNGDRFIAMDGRGKAWIASLQHENAIAIEPLSVQSELPIELTLMVALPKGNGFDEIVRCCTELGVSTFIPVISDRVLLRPSSQKLARWRRIATEAAEQSERAIVPTILDPQSLSISLQAVQGSEKYICVARGENASLRSRLQEGERREMTRREIVLLTGPEGGWTAQEVEKAKREGYIPVSLGKRILRAITSAIAAVSLVASFPQESHLSESQKTWGSYQSTE